MCFYAGVKCSLTVGKQLKLNKVFTCNNPVVSIFNRHSQELVFIAMPNYYFSGLYTILMSHDYNIL